MAVDLNIDQKDITLTRELLADVDNPAGIDGIINKVALAKTRSKQKNKVKIYNPGCEYKVGDLIYKEYKGPLPVGARKKIDLDIGVVLKVAAVKSRFGLTEIQLTYEGTSPFRKYTKYLERQKIELLLPHKQKKPCDKPEYMAEDDDPRFAQAPLVEKEFRKFKKKFVAAIAKEQDLVHVSESLLLLDKLQAIDEDVFDKVREKIQKAGISVSTEDVVQKIIKIKKKDEKYEAFCFAFNYRMFNDFKIDFQQVSNEGWGKWNLISNVYYLLKDSIISQPNSAAEEYVSDAPKAMLQKIKAIDEEILNGETDKYYLTLREIQAGALRLRPGLSDYIDSLEIEIEDVNTGKKHLVYYYRNENLLLGLDEIYKDNKVVQGSIVNCSVTENGVELGIRTTKKGTIADKIVFDKERNVFVAEDEKVASPAFINKSMFLEKEILDRFTEIAESLRKTEDFKDLVHKVFLNFGVKEKNYEMHLLKLYHIIDLIAPSEMRMVQEVLLNNPEFIPADKLLAIFYLDSDAVVEIEEEELLRRKEALAEKKREREEKKQSIIDEKKAEEEAARKIREERRRRREEEMRLKEQVTEDKAPEASDHVRVEIDNFEAAMEDFMQDGGSILGVEKGRKKKAFEAEEEAVETEETTEEDSEKVSAKPKKKGAKPSDDTLDMEDIESEIKLEELKEEVLEKKGRKRKVKKEKQVAYEDQKAGSFGNMFASQLDDAISKEEDQ